MNSFYCFYFSIYICGGLLNKELLNPHNRCSRVVESTVVSPHASYVSYMHELVLRNLCTRFSGAAAVSIFSTRKNPKKSEVFGAFCCPCGFILMKQWAH